MSLLLRKASQDVLNQADLHEYHTDIIHKVLHIVCECGKPFIIIPGITFNRPNPTKVEIEYAVELLENFLVDNAKAISKYMLLERNFQKIPPPKIPKGVELSAGTNSYYQFGKESYYFILRYTDSMFKVRLDKGNLLKSSDPKAITQDISFKNNTTLKELSIFKANFTLQEQYEQLLNEYADYKAKERKLQYMKSNLTSCEV